MVTVSPRRANLALSGLIFDEAGEQLLDQNSLPLYDVAPPAPILAISVTSRRIVRAIWYTPPPVIRYRYPPNQGFGATSEFAGGEHSQD